MKGQNKEFAPLVDFPKPFDAWSVDQRVAYNDGDQYLFGRVVGVYPHFIRVHIDAGYDTCFRFFDAQKELERIRG